MTKEGYILMPEEEYMEMRKKAIDMLLNAYCTDSRVCMVDRIHVFIQERDLLLKELIEGYEYITVPFALFFSSKIFGNLKLESNRRIRCLKVEYAMIPQKEITLMPKEKYMKMREDAIEKLSNACCIDSQWCIVDDTRVKKEEKDWLLKELVEGYEYLEVPLGLYFTSDIFMHLQNESRKRIRCIKIR